MTMICYVCQTPITGGKYAHSPAGEPVHRQKCHAVAWRFRRD